MTYDKKISLLGYCSGLGQKRKGLELAAPVLREHGLIENLNSMGVQLTDLGDLRPQENHSTSWEILSRLRETAYKSLKSNEVFVTIGGDHSLGLGSVQATLMKYPEAKVIWVDAHGDMNTPSTSLTGNFHGMPLAALLGLFETPLCGPVLKPENLLLIGVRDLDPAEKMFVEELSIRIITAEQSRNAPLQALRDVRLWLGDSFPKVHLSFDIDSIDPSIAPATGLRVPEGLLLDFAFQLLQNITTQSNVVSFDFVEFNPLMAQSTDELKKTVACANRLLTQALSSKFASQEQPIYF
jgi:arginase